MHVRPMHRANPAIVDELRGKLPPTYLKLPEIRRLTALSETTLLHESEVLAALVYLESRGEVKRANRRGWKLANSPSFSTITAVGGGLDAAAQATPVTLFESSESNVYDKDGNLCSL